MIVDRLNVFKRIARLLNDVEEEIKIRCGYVRRK